VDQPAALQKSSGSLQREAGFNFANDLPGLENAVVGMPLH
jgi:hypothetical protein